MTSLRSIRYGITTALLLGMGFTLQAGPELLVRAKGRDGKESNLFEKIYESRQNPNVHSWLVIDSWFLCWPQMGK